jgi:stalled ribosome rescue protein Dom34
MKKNVGLWIDHRKTVIVSITDEGEETREIRSKMEKHVRFASGSSQDGSAEDMRDRQFGNHLDAYYDEVILAIRDADSILILGPGEAKGELETRLNRARPKGGTVSVETADKMTARQIAAKVRQRL